MVYRRRYSSGRRGRSDRPYPLQRKDASLAKKVEFDTRRNKEIERLELVIRRGEVNDFKDAINEFPDHKKLAEIIKDEQESIDLSQKGDTETNTEIKVLHDKISKKENVNWDDLTAKALRNEYLANTLDKITKKIDLEMGRRRKIVEDFKDAIDSFPDRKKLAEIIEREPLNVYDNDSSKEAYMIICSLYRIILKQEDVNWNALHGAALRSEHLANTLHKITEKLSKMQTASNTHLHSEGQSLTGQLDKDSITIIQENPNWNRGRGRGRFATPPEADNTRPKEGVLFPTKFVDSGPSRSKQLDQTEINAILQSITHYLTPAVQTAFSNRVNNTQVKEYVDTMLRFMKEHYSNPDKRHERISWSKCNFGTNVPTFTDQLRSDIKRFLKEILPNAPGHMITVIRNHLFDREKKQSGGRKKQKTRIQASPDGS